MRGKKPNLDRLYKDNFMICLYDDDDMLCYEFDNPYEMAQTFSMKKEYIFTILSRFQTEPEKHKKICGYNLELVAIN